MLASAAAIMVLRYLPVPGFSVPSEAQPVALKVPPELEPADRLPASPGDFAGHNVLLVTFDTTRADRFGCYGNTRVQTPTLDQLARDGVLFSDATAPAPVTLPSHASILTGLYPYRHGARANGIFRLGDEHQLLSEILQERGYATAAFVSAFVLDARFGLNQGFGYYDDDVLGAAPTQWFRSPAREGGQTTARALAWLKSQGDRPFFAWVHYFDPHAPYTPPSPYAEQYKSFPYDGEVAYADAQLGELLAGLEEMKLGDRTLVIATADHGEGISQHDEWSHGCLIYDSTMRVPMVLACGRKLGGGVHVSRPVSLVDLLPTTLTLLGLETPAGLDGVDLTRPFEASRTVYMETAEGWLEYGFSPLVALRQGSMKYIHGPDPELYDVAADPFEERNRIKSDPATADALKRRLSEILGGDLEKAIMASPTHQLSPEDAAKMRTLGYAAPSGKVAPPTGVLPDPKSLMRLKQDVEAAVYGGDKLDLEKLLPKLESLAAEHPDVYMVHWYLAQAWTSKGDLDRAEATLKRCLELRPGLPPALLAIARINASQQEFEEALKYYDLMLKESPDHLGALREHARLLKELGRTQEAGEAAKRAFDIRPNDEEIVQDLVVTLQGLGQADELEKLLADAIQAEPTLSVPRNALADILRQKLRFAEAIDLLREGTRVSPDDPKLANNLGFLLISAPEKSLQNPVEAAMMLERTCQATGYKQPEYMLTLSVVYSVVQRLDEAIALGEKALALAKESGRTDLSAAIETRLGSFRQAKASGVSPILRPRETLFQTSSAPSPEVEPGHD